MSRTGYRAISAPSEHRPDDCSTSIGVRPEEYDGNPERRIRIIHQATRAFLADGFEGANLTDIAVASGVGKVTIYRYFNDKSDLLRHVLLNAAEHVALPLPEVLNLAQPVETVLLRYAGRFIHRALDLVEGLCPWHKLTRLMYAASLTHPDITSACRDIYRAHTIVPLRDYFAALIERGDLVDEDPAFLAENFMQMLSFADFAIVEPKRAPAREDVEMIARRVVSLFYRGVCRERLIQ